jgi:DNA-binding protein H-NS
VSETEASAPAPARKVSAAFEALAGMSIEELSSLIEKAEAWRAKKMEEARRALIAEFKEKASKLGLPFESLLPGAAGQAKAGKKKAPSAEARLPVKFRGPNGEEWSGRGKLPAWLAEAEKQGRKRDEFAV